MNVQIGNVQKCQIVECALFNIVKITVLIYVYHLVHKHNLYMIHKHIGVN